MADISRLRRSLLIFSVVGAVGFLTGLWLLAQSKDSFFSMITVILMAGGAGLFLWTVRARLKLEEAAGEAGAD